MLAKSAFTIETQPSLLSLLLEEQSELSAVDHFSQWHEANSIHASTYQSLMPTTSLQTGEQYAFEVDLDACSGCKACVVACHTLNGLEETETWRKVGTLASPSHFGLPIVQHVTTACHHCVDPGCLNGCPVKAYEKDQSTGIVRHLDDQCFGCKYCTMMCPYEVPQYSSTLGIVRKCDMCSQRLTHGESPACVQACPNQAIRIAIVNSASITAGTDSNSNKSLLPTAPLSHITKPTTQYKSRHLHENISSVASLESVSDYAHEGHLPLVTMLVLTQASVGMWGVILLQSITNKNAIDFTGAIVATILGFVGVHAALLHLGRPWLAFRAFLGWRTSWLSREAIAFGLYMGISGVTVAATVYFPSQPILAVQLGGLTTLVGLVAVTCSAMIYVATRRELWSLSRTGLDFGLTTIGLGLLGAAICSSPANITFLLLGVIACIFSSLPKLYHILRSERPSQLTATMSERSGRVIIGQLFTQWIALWALNAIALVALALFSSSFQLITALVVVAASLAAQLLNRWVYFASVVYRRMPGAST